MRIRVEIHRADVTYAAEVESDMMSVGRLRDLAEDVLAGLDPDPYPAPTKPHVVVPPGAVNPLPEPPLLDG